MTLAALGLTACAPTSGADEDVGEAKQAALFDNALFDNALFDNALFDNALFDNALFDNALTDPKARELYKYIVSCALPADQEINLTIAGVDYTFPGGAGLAPEWGEEGGSCDEECRSWVSACVISRLDYLGQTVLISMRGNHEGLETTASERASYTHIEATYYGDIFAHPQEIYACLPPGKTEIPRVCGPSLDTCIVKVQGNCDDLCGHQTKDGAYPGCRDSQPRNHGKDKKGKKHIGAVTVFLQ